MRLRPNADFYSFRPGRITLCILLGIVFHGLKLNSGKLLALVLDAFWPGVQIQKVQFS